MGANSDTEPPDSLDSAEDAAKWFGAMLDGVDVELVDADGVDRLFAVCRDVQSRLEAAIVRIGVRSNALAAEGIGVPARDLLVGSGEVRGTTARREAARAALAARSATLTRAMGSPTLGADRLDALVRRLGRLTDEHLARIDLDRLLDRAAQLPTETFDRALRRAVEATAEPEPSPEDEPSEDESEDDEPVDENERARAASEVRKWFDPRTGMGHIFATLDPERYEAATNALDQHTTTLANATGAEKDANLAATALVDLICSSGERSPHLPEIIVVVDHETMAGRRHDNSVAETAAGHGLSDEAIARMRCDATLRRVILDHRGIPVDVGRRYRTATDAQWAAIRAIYSTCAWHGCDQPLTHSQAHHIHEWEHGGSTDLNNMVPLCSHHHHLVHEGRWTIELLADRSLRITRPNGQPYRTTSPPTRRPPPTATPTSGSSPPLASAVA